MALENVVSTLKATLHQPLTFDEVYDVTFPLGVIFRDAALDYEKFIEINVFIAQTLGEAESEARFTCSRGASHDYHDQDRHQEICQMDRIDLFPT